METQPNSAQCIHFIKTDALHISGLIAYTPCCKPYGAEYAVMNNKPQYEPESVIFQPCQSLKKFDTEVNFWISNMDKRLLGQSLNFVWIIVSPKSYKENMRSSKIKKNCQIWSPHERLGSRQRGNYKKDREKRRRQDSMLNISDPLTKWYHTWDWDCRAQTITTGRAPKCNVLIRETPTQKERERDELPHRGLW